MIELPAKIDRFPTEKENFDWYKVVLTHQAGHVEFGTFDFRFDRRSVGFVDWRPRLRQSRALEGLTSDWLQFLQLFPEPQLGKSYSIRSRTRGLTRICLALIRESAGSIDASRRSLSRFDRGLSFCRCGKRSWRRSCGRASAQIRCKTCPQRSSPMSILDWPSWPKCNCPLRPSRIPRKRRCACMRLLLDCRIFRWTIVITISVKLERRKAAMPLLRSWRNPAAMRTICLSRSLKKLSSVWTAGMKSCDPSILAGTPKGTPTTRLNTRWQRMDRSGATPRLAISMRNGTFAAALTAVIGAECANA